MLHSRADAMSEDARLLEVYWIWRGCQTGMKKVDRQLFPVTFFRGSWHKDAQTPVRESPDGGLCVAGKRDLNSTS